MSTKQGLFAIAAAGLVVALTGCGTSTTTAGAGASNTSNTSSPSSSTSSMSTSPGAAPSENASPAGPVLVTIKDFKYTIPSSVAPGSKVTVKNEDAQNHTVTSSPHGAFDVNVPAGGTATFTAPTKPGSYKFICTFHADMLGALVVK